MQKVAFSKVPNWGIFFVCSSTVCARPDVSGRVPCQISSALRVPLAGGGVMGPGGDPGPDGHGFGFTNHRIFLAKNILQWPDFWGIHTRWWSCAGPRGWGVPPPPGVKERWEALKDPPPTLKPGQQNFRFYGQRPDTKPKNMVKNTDISVKNESRNCEFWNSLWAGVLSLPIATFVSGVSGECCEQATWCRTPCQTGRTS